MDSILFKDQMQRLLNFEKSPARIVSLVPSLTELTVDLGLENNLVGVTKFCVHPEHIKSSKIVVGGTKQVKIDKIVALKPDIILCNKEENSKEIIAALEEIAPIHISDINNLDDAMELITMYGKIFDKEECANDFILEINKSRDKFILFKNEKRKIKVAYFIWKNPWMVVGSITFIDSMLDEADFINVFKQETRYPEIELTNKELMEADYIFLSSEPYPFKYRHVANMQKILPNKKIKIVDGEMFSWYGSRLKKSYDYFQSLHS